jgi:hypothetical protein
VEILPAQGAPPVSLTPVAKGKNLQSESFHYFFWTPLGVLQVHFKVQQSDIVPIMAAAVVYTSDNLPPASLTPAFAAGIVDTSGIFATGINNTCGTGGKICRRCR